MLVLSKPIFYEFAGQIFPPSRYLHREWDIDIALQARLFTRLCADYRTIIFNGNNAISHERFWQQYPPRPNDTAYER